DERPLVAQRGTAANGYVIARRKAKLSTDIQGRIVELRVEEGNRVKAGDLVARLDTRELEATLQRVRADLGTAKASLELAELELARRTPLLASGDVSKADVDAARTERDGAQATVNSLEAAVQETEVRISKSSVLAPFDGVITDKNAEVGEIVSSLGAGANSRGSVATLVDFDTLEVQVELAQTSLKAAKEGAPVVIYLDAYPDRAYRGSVRKIWPTADRQKSTVELRAEFLERDERILPEMGVRVVFTGQDTGAPAEAEVRVPKAAVVPSPDGPMVWVVVEGKVAARRIEVAGRSPEGGIVPVQSAPDGDTLAVASGLAGGETVVLDPPAGGLSDGTAVRLPDADT
ncbi:MAG TPA: efflux RND transporter periplasmic adaptor subunit, partial [Planctomycetota bacterium]|nr:efflux RND transporter periplasmic adaptor subunit [Planctomycetota bacterium]